MEKEKIIRIEATNKFGKHYIWSASMLLWDELPKWLLQAIKMELPYYRISVVKYDYEKKH